jgi:predicted DNA-binding transcriptional regulator AlpA
MMDVPPTVSVPRVTQTTALKRSTIWTNFAEARA